MNGVTDEDNVATSVSTPTATSAEQNEIAVSDNEVGFSFFLQNSNV